MFTILGGDGKEYGPVTAEKIHEWIKSGRANAQTSIKRTGDAEWTTIGALAEFSAPPAVPAVIAPAGVTAVPIPTGGAEPASRWSRLGAALLDGIISSICFLPGSALLFSGGILNKTHAATPLIFVGFCVLGAAFLLVLGIQIYLLTTRGQTMGKKFIGIKIVSFDDGSNPGFVKAFLLRSFVNGMIGAVPGVGMIYSLVDLCFIFRDDRRCVHDLLAGTVVIKA